MATPETSRKRRRRFGPRFTLQSLSEQDGFSQERTAGEEAGLLSRPNFGPLGHVGICEEHLRPTDFKFADQFECVTVFGKMRLKTKAQLSLCELSLLNTINAFNGEITYNYINFVIMISVFDSLFIGAVALVLLYFYLSLSFKYWKKRGCDSDDQVSILFGSLTDALMCRKTYGEIFTSLYDKFPGRKVVGYFKFHTPGLVVRDPEIVRKILINDFHYFRNNDVTVDSEVDPIMGNNVFVLKDEMWKKRRALITPAFTSGKIKGMYPVMNEVALDLVEFLKQHPEDLHVKHAMSRYTSEIVARCAFGIDSKNLKDPNPEMVELGKLIFEPTFVKNIQIMTFFLMPKAVKFLGLKMVPDKVINFFQGILRDVIQVRQKNNIERNDFLQYLIEVKRKTEEVAKGNIHSEVVPKEYTDEDILSGCIMFFVEGYETSSLILNNVLYNLALHKDVQERLREEIDGALEEGELTFEKLHALEYLHCVYAESNRILPATFTMQKVCTERYEMDIGKEKPLVVEKDTSVVIPVYAIHNDPLLWESPQEFRPERFQNKGEANAKAKGIYMPFSDGPRVCPGSRIATTMIKLAVVQILSHLEVHPTSRTPQKIEPDPNYFMIAHKGGIYLRFEERKKS